MKKIFLFNLLMMFSLMLSSCGTQFGLVYGVQLVGEGDGQFEVTFPQGTYAMNGKAALDLNVGDSILFNNVEPITKNEVLHNATRKEIRAMEYVNDSIANTFNIISGDGTYDLWLKGFVKEIGTGLVFSIDKHITNKKALIKGKVVNNEFCPYIK